MDIVSDMMGAAVGLLLILLTGHGLVFLAGAAMYVLQSLGLYDLARRRGIQKNWTAWVPVLRLWTLGSLSDQYQYVVRHRFRSRRKGLMALGIGSALLWVAYAVLYAGGLLGLIGQLSWLEMDTIADLLYAIQSQPALMAAAGVSLIISALNLLEAVLRWVCLHDVYASCQPDKKVLYTVLSILLPVTQPFFLFACRKKDLGMPPRRDPVQPQ